MVEPNFLNNNRSVKYGFFGAQGGMSEGIYTSLNCGLGTQDCTKNIAENRKRACEVLGFGSDNLVTLYQIHSNRCIYVEHVSEERQEADALVTDEANIALGILTADCAPVLLYGEKENGDPVIGAAHAGWKGALYGVLQSTVKMMVEKGCVPNSMRACIGPSIAQKSYEVSHNFADAFLDQDEGNEHFFKNAQKEGHLMFDLPGYAASQLAQAGVGHVSIIDRDTYALEDKFFSYRRATHRNENDYGRQISIIGIL